MVAKSVIKGVPECIGDAKNAGEEQDLHRRVSVSADHQAHEEMGPRQVSRGQAKGFGTRDRENDQRDKYERIRQAKALCLHR